MERRFRFGVSLGATRSREKWIDQARTAEALGYDVAVVPDHVGRHLAPFPALLAAAEASENMRVGTYVVANDYRHPLLVAQEAATVDVLSGGRLEFGMGTGWMDDAYASLGIPLEAPAVRVARLEEAVTIIDHHFRGEPFSFRGAHYHVGEADPKPRPAQRPRPPLLIGGGGERILTLAARAADIVSVSLRSHRDGSGFDLSDLTTEAYGAKIETIRATASAAGRDPELNILLQSFEVTNNRTAFATRRAAELGMTVRDLVALPYGLFGTLEQMAEDLLERRNRFGISYITVLTHHMRAFAPLLERLAGR